MQEIADKSDCMQANCLGIQVFNLCANLELVWMLLLQLSLTMMVFIHVKPNF